MGFALETAVRWEYQHARAGDSSLAVLDGEIAGKVSPDAQGWQIWITDINGRWQYVERSRGSRADAELLLVDLIEDVRQAVAA